MIRQRVTVAMSVVLILAGCDQLSGKHEIVRAGNQTFLLNKGTGEAKLVDGTALVAVKAPDASAGNEPFKKAKTWPQQQINDLPGVKFKLRTKYRDGAMLWSIEATPFAGDLEQAYKATQLGALAQPTVMIELFDDEGFRVGEAIDVKIRLGSRTVNDKNEVVELNWSGMLPMSEESYKSTFLVSTRWYGFKKE